MEQFWSIFMFWIFWQFCDFVLATLKVQWKKLPQAALNVKHYLRDGKGYFRDGMRNLVSNDLY